MKSHLLNFKLEVNDEVSKLSNEKHNTQKLVSVIDRQFSCKMCNEQYKHSGTLN